MLLEEWLRAHDGAAHSSDIYAAGFSKHAIAAGVRSGRMLRFRRSWIALRECDSAILAAIGIGGRLTCVSAARKLGLWVPTHAGVHVAVSPGAARIKTEGLRVHWSTGPAPAAARAVVDPLINVLHHVARCQELAAALAIWESALNKKLVDAAVLERIEWHSERADHIVALCTNLSDSGLETHFVDLMRAIGVAVQQQVWIDGHPIDALIGDRLVVQLDGFAHHSSPADRRRDIEADARLRLRGYTVVRFDYYQVLFQPDLVQNVIRAAIAQGLHRAA
ncbi:endonuclease domain-containing protein [Microbacterium sp. LWH12-1.2]|uniref:endonuclease domain-containing protein n=1 Tax=Microbacterium sp. LWH12-1.2 TaxID=3135259 RepID=UPI00342E00F5